MATLRAYQCEWIGTPYSRTVHAATAGKARYSYWMDIHDAYYHVKIMDIRVKSLGAPRDDPNFNRTAANRGRPHRRVGHSGMVDGVRAQLCDRTDGAHFVVMFNEGKLAGKTAIYHPDELQYLGVA